MTSRLKKIDPVERQIQILMDHRDSIDRAIEALAATLPRKPRRRFKLVFVNGDGKRIIYDR